MFHFENIRKKHFGFLLFLLNIMEAKLFTAFHLDFKMVLINPNLYFWGANKLFSQPDYRDAHWGIFPPNAIHKVWIMSPSSHIYITLWRQ